VMRGEISKFSSSAVPVFLFMFDTDKKTTG
jgi:hypothetical protein